MRLIQILLPIYSNTRVPFEQNLFTDLRDELVERFGGITAYTRAPVHGLWQERERVVRDELIIYEIMVEAWTRTGAVNSTLAGKRSSSNPLLSGHEIELL